MNATAFTSFKYYCSVTVEKIDRRFFILVAAALIVSVVFDQLFHVLSHFEDLTEMMSNSLMTYFNPSEYYGTSYPAAGALIWTIILCVSTITWIIFQEVNNKAETRFGTMFSMRISSITIICGLIALLIYQFIVATEDALYTFNNSFWSVAIWLGVVIVIWLALADILGLLNKKTIDQE